ncbi:MFS transporter [Polyangium jinanense]|uniref:MFS transporter n=1 Tax=Polyangium jinanense TaxID=2829994 RepID=A0A9X3XAE0_9BACT|nr:MFS transporter [Polyangium jinanense]MDC3957054.1 MFS transporter [Polyangium jinanense]MDC3987072.1 MFS transporter [Polyangium jinanense]
MAEPRPRIPARLLVAIALSASLAPLNSTMVAVALPEMSRDLHAESSVLRQGLVSSYLLTNIVLQSPGGKLGDRLGYRRAIALGQVLFALGAALAYVWPRLPGLTAARILMAAGGAILAPSAFALLRTELPAEVRGRAFGTLGAILGLSAGLGPKIGALLVTHFGWTSIFLANVPVLLVSAAVLHLGASATSRPNEPAVARPRFDLLGSVLLGASLLGLVIGLENKDLRWAAALGVLGFVPFALWERRAADPIIDFSLFRRRTFVAGSLLIAIQNFAMYSTLFELPQVAGRLFGAGPRDVGNTLVTMMAMMIVASPVAGRASERFGARAVALAGSALALGGMVLLVLLPFHSVTDAVPALGLLGLGLGLTSAPSQASSMNDVPREKSGMAAGLTSTMRYLGGIAGLTVLGLVLTESKVPEIARHEHATSIVIFCVSLVVTLGCALLLPGRLPTPVPSAETR